MSKDACDTCQYFDKEVSFLPAWSKCKVLSGESHLGDYFSPVHLVFTHPEFICGKHSPLEPKELTSKFKPRKTCREYREGETTDGGRWYRCMGAKTQSIIEDKKARLSPTPPLFGLYYCLENQLL